MDVFIDPELITQYGTYCVGFVGVGIALSVITWAVGYVISVIVRVSKGG